MLWTAAGHRVRFVYLATNRAEWDPHGELRMRRRLEARDAGRHLGLGYQVIDDPSGDALHEQQVEAALLTLFHAYSPDVIVIPSVHDRHGDHAALGHLVSRLVGTPRPGINPALLYFNDDAAMRADVIIPIGPLMQRKSAALDSHRAVAYVYEPAAHSADSASIAVKRPQQIHAVQRDGAYARAQLSGQVESFTIPEGTNAAHAALLERLRLR
jgi:LmbE family N-acetylglucosaminyl deacetylase